MNAMHQPVRALFALTLCALPAVGQEVALVSIVDDDQVGVPTGSPARGRGTYVLDPRANTLEFFIEYDGLVGAEFAAHLHGVGAGGGVVLHGLPPTNPKAGTWHYPEDVEANLLAGVFYVNIHTDVHPGGEIAGHLVRVPDSIARYCAGGACPCGNDDDDAGCASSTGEGARLVPQGSGSVLHDDLVLRLEGAPPRSIGVVFMGPDEAALPFADGRLCVAPGGLGFFRFPPRATGAGGGFAEGPGLAAHSRSGFPLAGRIAPGRGWSFQAWFRDPLGPCGLGANLSDALRVDFTY